MRRRLPGRLPAHGRNRVQGPRRFLPYQPPRGSQAPGGTGRKVGRFGPRSIIPNGIVDLLYYSHHPCPSLPPGGPLLVGTTVVGSYPRIGERPEEQSLRRAIARLDKGEIDAAQLRTAEREVVKAVLREQNEAGIDAVTDGQISWYDSQSHIARRLTSIEIGGLVRYFDTNTYYRQPIVRGAVAWKEPILGDEWKFAQANSKAPVKAILTGPLTLASLADDKHYRSEKPLVLGLIDARNTKKEVPGEVAKKVLELRDLVDLKTTDLSPSNGLEFLPRERAREKLGILSAAARQVGVAA